MSAVSVVFAGGGCRCFFGVGLLQGLSEALGEPLPVREWAGVSAGSAMAVMMALDRAPELSARFMELAGANPANFQPRRLLRRERPWPHEGMYRQAMDEALAGEGLDRLRAAPPVRILLAWAPAGRRLVVGSLRAAQHYRRRKRAFGLHGPERPPGGLRAEVVTAQALPDAAAVTEAVIRSSATPPVTRLPRAQGRTYIDGGLIDNVPVRALSAEARRGPVIVLLSRPHPPSALPQRRDRLYFAPAQPVPVEAWDYASPEGLAATLDLGRELGRRALPRLEGLLKEAVI